MADRQTNPHDFLQQTLDKLKGLDGLSNSAAINIMQLTIRLVPCVEGRSR